MAVESDGISRRRFGAFLLAAPVGLLVAARAPDPACFDPAALPPGQKSMRQSLGFQLQSSDPKKNCGGCAFFQPKGGACGTCMLLSGGAVTSTSVCNSWAAKH
jgi:hypothetical protein